MSNDTQSQDRPGAGEANTSTALEPSTTNSTSQEAAHRLAEAIDDFLGDLDKKFSAISNEILTRLDDMAERCDRLEQEMLLRDQSSSVAKSATSGSRRQRNYGEVQAAARPRSTTRPAAASSRQSGHGERHQEGSASRPLLDQSDGHSDLVPSAFEPNRPSLGTISELLDSQEQGKVALEHLAPCPFAPEYSMYTYYSAAWGTRQSQHGRSNASGAIRTAHEEQTIFESGLTLPDVFGYIELEEPQATDEGNGKCSWARYELQFGLRETGTVYVV